VREIQWANLPQGISTNFDWSRRYGRSIKIL